MKTGERRTMESQQRRYATFREDDLNALISVVIPKHEPEKTYQ